MPSDSEYRQLSLRMGRSGSIRVERKTRSRESLDTLILGSLSTAIGVVVMIALLSWPARRDSLMLCPTPGVAWEAGRDPLWGNGVMSSIARITIPGDLQSRNRAFATRAGTLSRALPAP